ncbi:molybdopterin-binding protein [Effusibacillus lacus]|uniref:Molybdopterin molybdenumtransferase n=1 Tax=Effusibacillus lacus TaxID=1348429 RepID=A0A292YI71_9BACL|nr:molybdopterin-binding protein [Effusibacillus lacus]TCS74329.1 molybdenum cofactor synthesis domain-containing protein [Effusibacillus lacus]GAX88786.1 molybdopterin-binding protein [Effusibacillus lacus]
MREIHVRDAVGLRLAHDLTRIVPGEFKGRIFRKGHLIREEDIPTLLDIGKEHIYVLELQPGQLHEEDAAIRLAGAVMGSHLTATEPSEGKVVLKSEIKGLLKIDKEALLMLNSIGDLLVVTKKSDSVVQPGDAVAAMKAVPLIISEQKVVQAETIARMSAPVISVLPFRTMKVGIVTTGSEVASGRIEDKFGPRVREKLSLYQADVLGHKIVGDKKEDIQAAIREFLDQGAEVVLCTGGMSVDPDDRTPGAIRELATEVVAYGMPIFPGSMMMLAYIGGVPVFGLPGAVIYEEVTAFDLFLPRILAGDKVSGQEIAELAHGGLLK